MLIVLVNSYCMKPSKLFIGFLLFSGINLAPLDLSASANPFDPIAMVQCKADVAEVTISSAAEGKHSLQLNGHSGETFVAFRVKETGTITEAILRLTEITIIEFGESIAGRTIEILSDSPESILRLSLANNQITHFNGGGAWINLRHLSLIGNHLVEFRASPHWVNLQSIYLPGNPNLPYLPSLNKGIILQDAEIIRAHYIDSQPVYTSLIGSLFGSLP